MNRPLMSQGGVVLVAVLWLVAAISLVTVGIVQSVRGEVRAVGLARQAVAAAALADAAILLALQGRHAQQQEPRSVMQTLPVQFEGVQYDVVIQPLNGLLDINHAPLELLADFYRHVGGLDPTAAQALAQATVQTRQRKNAKGSAQGFDSTEDLLSVSQMTYGLYAKLSPLVTADLKEGSGRINPMAAPAALLAVLAGGDVARANDLAAKRDLNPNQMDASFLKPDYSETTPSKNLHIQVRANLPDGGAVEKVWSVFWGGDPRSQLPWRVLWSHVSVLPALSAAH